MVPVASSLAACAPAAPSQRETVVPIAEPAPAVPAPLPPPEPDEPQEVVVKAPEPEPVPMLVEDHSDEAYVTGAVSGGVMGGVPGGVMGGVPGGVVGGVPGGVVGVVGGLLPPPPPPPPKASLLGSAAWNCPFPKEADAAKVDSAVVTLVVTVKPDGQPLTAMVLQDPGNGFGRAAKQCALSRSYKPAVDDQGNPIQSTTPPIRVRFSR